VTFDAGTLGFVQWLISQGIGVAVAVVVLWLVGRKVDQQNGNIEQLTIAINALAALVQSHMPPGR